MSRSGGVYTAPANSWNPAVEGTPVDEADWNATLSDIEGALSESTYTGGLGANGNRLIVNGIIQSGASSYSSQSGGVASAYAGAGSSNHGGTAIGGSTAIGNNLNVVVQGNHNTVIVNSNQVNNGDVTAGTDLNGTLRLP